MPKGQPKHFVENNVFKKDKKHISICDLRPDEVDIIILSKLNSQPAKGGKRTQCRWTDDELQLRDAVILSYMVENGLSKYRTQQEIQSRWDISATTAKRYINEAIHRFAEDVTDNGQKVKSVFIEKFENIASLALNSGQYDTAIRAFTEISKMMGYYAKEEKDINLNGTINFDFDGTNN